MYMNGAEIPSEHLTKLFGTVEEHRKFCSLHLRFYASALRLFSGSRGIIAASSGRRFSSNVRLNSSLWQGFEERGQFRWWEDEMDSKYIRVGRIEAV